jgi:hypothetical protein
MSPAAKVEAGYKLMKEAVAEYLGSHPEGVSAADMRDALGFTDENEKGERKGYAMWAVLNLLIREERVRIDKDTSPHLIKPLR